MGEAGRPGVFDFFKNSTLTGTILFRFTEDRQSLVAWNAISEETSEQQFPIVPIKGGIEIIWTEVNPSSRFIAKRKQCGIAAAAIKSKTAAVSGETKCKTATVSTRVIKNKKAHIMQPIIKYAV